MNTPSWLLDLLTTGVTIPWDKKPPRFLLTNNQSAVNNSVIPDVRKIITEYESYGFVRRVSAVPHCVLPLQLKVTGGKVALIYDMSPVNSYVKKLSFKLEGWEEMFDYAKVSNCAIKFDLKKFYHEIDINPKFQTYFGFSYTMVDGEDPVYFVWQTLPYGYTRAPYIARQIMKPLIAKWRRLGGLVVVFYDDGMAVSSSSVLVRKLTIEVQCDLLLAGLVPGVDKCIWTPTTNIDWNGLTFDFERRCLSIMKKRIEKTKSYI